MQPGRLGDCVWIAFRALLSRRAHKNGFNSTLLMKTPVRITKAHHLFILPLLAAITLAANAWGAGTIDLGMLRTNHTATLLKSGLVLITGGLNETEVFSSSLLYDPRTRTLVATGSLNAARANHTATLLPNGKVLITGGDKNGTILTSAELYDPRRGTFKTVSSQMSSARNKHTATLLQDGRVLLVGGATADLFDPATMTFSATTGAPVNRKNHAAILLANGT